MNLKRFGTKMEFIKIFKFCLTPAFEMLYFTSLAEQLIKISIILTYFEDINNKRQQKLHVRGYHFLFRNLINI